MIAKRKYISQEKSIFLSIPGYVSIFNFLWYTIKPVHIHIYLLACITWVLVFYNKTSPSLGKSKNVRYFIINAHLL